MARLQFGLALDFGATHATLDQVLAEYVPLIHLAERYGFESVWAGESYPQRPGAAHLPAPLLALAALAPQTRLRLGTGVVLLPMWAPLRLAYEAAVLDQLAGGRFTLGVGLGSPADWARFGVERAGLGDRVDETLALLRALWSGAPGYQGRLLRVEGGLAPLPVQPGGPPLWVGGLAPRAARRAARYGDAWYASTRYTLEEIRVQSARYRAALAAAGKGSAPACVSVNRLAVIAPTDAAAWRDGGPHVARVLRYYAAAGSPLPRRDGRPARPDDPDLVEALADALCLIGSPATVVARLEAYAAVGVTHVQLRVAPGEMPAELVAQSIRLAGERVLPYFR